MVSKNLYFQIITRVCLVVLNSFLCCYFFLQKEYTLTLLASVVLAVQIIYFILYINRTNTKIAYFINAIKNDDYSFRFPEENDSKTLIELHKSLNKLNDTILETQLKLKIQEQQYQTILKHAEIGMLVIQKEGYIFFSNPKAEQLLQKSPLNHIRQLAAVNDQLYKLFQQLSPFDKKLITITNEKDRNTLTLKATEISINKEVLLLVIIQDIHQEMEAKESESWDKLIRVLTHEIMNTIAPITSISNSVSYLLEDQQSGKENVIQKAIDGIKIIEEQSISLMNFVQSYRKILQVPEPDKTLISQDKIIEKVTMLFQQEFVEKHISFRVIKEPTSLHFYIDEKLMIQVLQNLIKNAIHAVETIKHAEITLQTGIAAQQKFIMVTDNGKGISTTEIAQIFIPFYTQKENGTGIGLSLSKQIVKLHGGQLTVTSKPNKKTSFKMSF
ncbi:sensor histidine kinase [Zhouia sp. PK063]|uniref:sensor histidine kinase n=1 Tax=Zhouia sp. PK063 TaxID=3373602 RepID=UPI003799D94C